MSQIALITGAAGALGSAVAQRLATSGCRVVLTGRDEQALAEHACPADLKIAANLSQPEDVEELFLSIDTHFDEPPSLLAHCAGSVCIRPLHRLTYDQYRTCLQNNLDSAFLTLQQFVQRLIARNAPGGVVLVSSIAARIGISNHAAVAVAKAGIEGLVRSAAADYASCAIRVNGIAPGLMRSKATEGFFAGGKTEALLTAQYPIGRYGQAKDAADAVCWLLSDEAGWITGQVLAVDGGFSSIRPLVKP